MPEGYKTVRCAASGEFEEKRSRFIGNASPVKTEDEAFGFISSVRSQNRKARHNVYAYILRSSNRSGYSDDGEPQGTGGIPVLEVLRKEGLTDVCVVVTRYFGGVLLGTGGLARAYGTACKLAVDNAGISEICRCSEFKIRCGYSVYGKISHLIAQPDVKKTGESFSDEVQTRLLVRSDFSEELKKNLIDAANGKLQIEETKDIYEDFS